MLLTGFDAPIEGVMYLDRPIREAELLQAIARVNRTGHGKTAGIVVDYYGVAKHLKEALTAYSAEDIEGALQVADEIPKLRDRHTRVMALFEARNVDAIRDAEAAVEALGDERLRAEFTVKLKQFLATLDSRAASPRGTTVGARRRETRGDLRPSPEPLPGGPAPARQEHRSQGAGAH